MKNYKKVISILFVLAFVSTLAFSNIFAQPAQESAVAGIVSDGKTFSLRQPVTVSWSELLPYGNSFRVELYDLKTKKLVNKIVVTDGFLTYDKAFFKVSKTYKVTVTALNALGTSVKSETKYFSVGQPSAVPSSNDPLVVTGVEAVTEVISPDLTAAPEQSATPINDAYNGVASMIKSANPYFASSNVNASSSLWFNKGLNSQYDAYLSNVLSNSYSANRFRYDYSFEATLFNLVNQYRVEMGREPLIWSDSLAMVARLRVTAGSDAGMTHDIAEVGGLPISTVTNLGWKQKTIFGENIVGKASTASVDWASRANELVTMWKNSPGHNENMLDDRYHYGAIAVVVGDNSFGRGMTGAWALQLFAG